MLWRFDIIHPSIQFTCKGRLSISDVQCSSRLGILIQSIDIRLRPDSVAMFNPAPGTCCGIVQTQRERRILPDYNRE